MTYVHTVSLFLLIALAGVFYVVTTESNAHTTSLAAYAQDGTELSLEITLDHKKPEPRPAIIIPTSAVAGAADRQPETIREETETTRAETVAPEVSHEGRPELQTQTRSSFVVPFYSQFTDISSPSWQKVGCGIASLAMLIELYEPGQISVDSLLEEGIDSGAYLSNAGWIHQGLINLARSYGLDGRTHDFSGSEAAVALAALTASLEEGPVMASVHYTFDPQNPIPHLVVVNEVREGEVYYNDPAESAGGGNISLAQFMKAWKQRYIEIRPAV